MELRMSAAALGDWQAQCDSLIHETRDMVAVPSDGSVILSLAAQTLLARRALDEIRGLLDEYEREYLTPRNLTFEGMLLPRIARIVRGSPNTQGQPRPTESL
jgi:hypothetical protein